MSLSGGCSRVFTSLGREELVLEPGVGEEQDAAHQDSLCFNIILTDSMESESWTALGGKGP